MWIAVVNILILTYVLRWIRSLSKCDCAKGLSRDYMQFFFSAGLVFQFSRLLSLSHLLNWPMAFLAVIYGFVALRYIKIEKNKDCKCAGRVLTPQFFWLTTAQTIWALLQIILSL
jgi:hypothetical protein